MIHMSAWFSLPHLQFQDTAPPISEQEVSHSTQSLGRLMNALEKTRDSAFSQNRLAIIHPFLPVTVNQRILCFGKISDGKTSSGGSRWKSCLLEH
uniref:Alternative protein OSBPL6 n=1 Tax=Homo sapiens TaxID=9606 RepID=L8EBA8_HUMAN|nr:alternative protein OSBPL6 [Homo sapiens]